MTNEITCNALEYLLVFWSVLATILHVMLLVVSTSNPFGKFYGMGLIYGAFVWTGFSISYRYWKGKR